MVASSTCQSGSLLEQLTAAIEAEDEEEMEALGAAMAELGGEIGGAMEELGVGVVDNICMMEADAGKECLETCMELSPTCDFIAGESVLLCDIGGMPCLEQNGHSLYVCGGGSCVVR